MVSTTKKPRTQPSAGKLMAIVFWQMRGIEYMPKGATINAYVNTTTKNLHKATDVKRTDRKMLPLHDNASEHEAAKVKSIMEGCKLLELDKPAYSPKMSPSDSYLFRLLKENLQGRRFNSMIVWKPP